MSLNDPVTAASGTSPNFVTVLSGYSAPSTSARRAERRAVMAKRSAGSALAVANRVSGRMSAHERTWPAPSRVKVRAPKTVTRKADSNVSDASSVGSGRAKYEASGGGGGVADASAARSAFRSVPPATSMRSLLCDPGRQQVVEDVGDARRCSLERHEISPGERLADLGHHVGGDVDVVAVRHQAGDDA